MSEEMNLQSGKLYWPTTMEMKPTYKSLSEDIECDICIIGAGSSGAQLAYMLKDSGAKVVIVDKRKVGAGSTSTNTALIQILGDKTTTALVNSFGEKNTILHYQLCQKAIEEIESTCRLLPIDSEYKVRDSLYFASTKEDIQELKTDYNMLKKYGFQVDWLTQSQIRERYPFEKEAAIYSYNDGEMNPLKYVYGLLEACKESGIEIYEQTEIVGKRLEKEMAFLYTKEKYCIKAKYVVFAGGYENLDMKKDKNAALESSYSIVTTPVTDLSSWYKQTLIWETARPYIYMRTTADNRVIIGGLDEITSNPEKRDQKIVHKRGLLLGEFQKLFPNINVQAEFYLGAFYGGTHNGLPMIKMYEQYPRCFFIFGYGDNGTVYNQVLGRIVKNLIETGNDENLSLYN